MDGESSVAADAGELMAETFTVEDHQLWLRRIQLAEQEQVKRHAAWKQSLDLYSMQFWRDHGFTGNLTDITIPVNYTTTFVLTKVASIFARNPKIFVRPRPGHARYQPFAETMERLIERFWDEADLKEVFLEVVRDAIIFGIGWVECGYVESLDSLPDPLPSPQEDTGMLAGLLQSLQEFVNKPTPMPSEQGELEDRKQVGEFYCIRRSPYDVLLPAGFHSYSSLPSLILKERLAAEDFLRHPRYKFKDEALRSYKVPKLSNGKFVTSDYTRPMGPGSFHSRWGVDDTHQVELFHIQDRRSMRWTTISKLSTKPHAGPDPWPHFSEGFSLLPLTFTSIPETPDRANAYPFGSIEPIIGQVIEKSNIRQQMSEHRKRANVIVFAQKGSTTEQEVSNYAQATGAVEVVPVTNPQAMQVSPPIAVPPAVLQTEAAIDRDLDRDSQLNLILSDVSRAAQIDKATVANILQGNTNLGTVFSVDRIEAFSKRVSRYQTGLFWQYMSRFDVGEWLGVLPEPDAWPPLPQNPDLARKRVRKELELRVEAGSTRPIQDDVLDREQYIRALATMQAVDPLLFKRISRDALAILAKKFREPALENLILQAISEDEMQVIQMENQLLAQGIPQIVGVCEDHEAHLRGHVSVANTPMGKAHLQAHQVRLNELLAGQTAAGQGVRQSVSAPSAAEVGRMGTPGMSDVGGQSLNLRKGTGAEVLTP